MGGLSTLPVIRGSADPVVGEPGRRRPLDAVGAVWLTQPVSLGRRVWAQFRSNRVAVAALVVLVGLILFVLAADLIAAATGFPYQKGDLRNQLAPPLTGNHLLGTDANGRDVLVRLAYGGRTSFVVAGLAAAATLGIGASLGATAGYAGGLVDALVMRLADVLLSIPGISLLVLVSVLYQPGPVGLAVVLAVISWTDIARLVRAEVLSLRKREFVLAARLGGASGGHIVVRHLLPNVLPTMLVWISLAIPGLILIEASLSFLGFGVEIPTPSWGNMLEQAKNFYNRSWTNVFFPGFMIYVSVLCVNIVGNGLRDAFDPRLHR